SVVQQFVTAWVSELHLLGYVAGIYGSAASTIRDMLPLTTTGSAPDHVDYAHWDKNPSIFGDAYVPDTYWPNHQRIHQYRGGHDETYGRVTLNIDTNTVDAPVVGPGGVVGPTPAPPPPQAGSVATADGQATVSWPAGALPGGVTVAATPSTLAADTGGFGA